MAAPCNCPRCRSAHTAPRPPTATTSRSHFAAYANEFTLTTCGAGTVIPLRKHNSQGRYACQHGMVTIPDDGYYMLLWELTVHHVKSTVHLHLGINDKSSVLASNLKPGCDSGQQVTWLRRGDKLSLQAPGNEHGELHATNTQLTIIRLG